MNILSTRVEREAVFGHIDFISAPVKGNPENISIQGSWARDNLCIVDLPQLMGISGAPSSGKIQIHRLAVDSIRFLWQEWEQEGNLDLVHQWGGSFCPRFIRGSKTVLSNHAYGTAFDINMQWNPLGKDPAPLGALGSVRALVEAANRNGWFWGGDYQNRKDGMHFEYMGPDAND